MQKVLVNLFLHHALAEAVSNSSSASKRLLLQIFNYYACTIVYADAVPTA